MPRHTRRHTLSSQRREWACNDPRSSWSRACGLFGLVSPVRRAQLFPSLASRFSPEADFLKKVEAIDGISFVETQTYTLMPMD